MSEFPLKQVSMTPVLTSSHQRHAFLAEPDGASLRALWRRLHQVRIRPLQYSDPFLVQVGLFRVRERSDLRQLFPFKGSDCPRRRVRHASWRTLHSRRPSHLFPSMIPTHRMLGLLHRHTQLDAVFRHILGRRQCLVLLLKFRRHPGDLHSRRVYLTRDEIFFKTPLP
jgi:hypothetical protein